MTNIIIEWVEQPESEVIVEFGTALLFERPDGRFQIDGGADFEKCRAREWAARFLDVRLPVEV
jgi:hypothetical protein